MPGLSRHPQSRLGRGLLHGRPRHKAGVPIKGVSPISYFPSSAWSYPDQLPYDEDAEPRPTPELLDIISRDNRRVYNMRSVLDILFDNTDWFEVQPQFGKAIICALAHLGGHPVAVVANQPNVLAGSIDADAADKAAHFIMVADSFHLPIVFLADNPGMLPGSRSERTGVLRAGARMFAAQTAATTPRAASTVAITTVAVISCIPGKTGLSGGPNP